MNVIEAIIARLIPNLSSFTVSDYIKDAIKELAGIYFQAFTVSGDTISPTPSDAEKEIIALTAGRRILKYKKMEATQMAASISNVAGKSDLRSVAYQAQKDIDQFSKDINDKINVARLSGVFGSVDIAQASHSED